MVRLRVEIAFSFPATLTKTVYASLESLSGVLLVQGYNEYKLGEGLGSYSLYQGSRRAYNPYNTTRTSVPALKTSRVATAHGGPRVRVLHPYAHSR